MPKKIQNKEYYVAFLGGKCVSCGATENLQFDHIDPSTKKFTISAYFKCKETTVMAEVKKCQLLCQTCHTIKSNKAIIKKPSICGTYNAYCYGCRCDLCRKANAEYNYAWKRKDRGF